MDALVRLYEDRFTELGRDIRTLGWKSVADQALRFKILCDIGDLRATTICDIGCGFGDQVDYLETRFGKFSYTGIDISPSLIRKAAELHPDREFVCANMVEAPLSRADYFLLSGALNFRVHDNEELSQTMLRKMFAAANKGVAVNFLSSYVNFQRPQNYHHSPEAVFSYARSLTPWVTLRHDYPLWEFSIYLYKYPPAQGS
jgi:ubiquinone/menaquinone biosynthesis C-methylase UbiE